MNSETVQRLQARRVLALLDASRHSVAALHAAVELARDHRAELVALYVEDEDLLRSAGFPFSREIGARSGLARPLTPATMEATLSRQHQQVNSALESAVLGHGVAYSLRVSRGRVVAATLQQLVAGDVLLLGKSGLSAQCGGLRLGSTCKALLLQASCTVVVYDQQVDVRPGPLRVLSRHTPATTIDLPWCTVIEPLEVKDAQGLKQQLGHARAGALQLQRAELQALMAQDSELLARIPIPVIVVPDPL